MIKKLKLTNFRNLKDLEILLNPKVNIFLGQNAQGKTNIVESIFLTLTGDSFRFAANENLIQHGQEISNIKMSLNHNDLIYESNISIQNTKKERLLNNKKISALDFSTKFPCVVFSPESLQSIKESSEQRRILIDELVLSASKQGNHILSDYKKVLKTKNKILKNYKSEILNKKQAVDLLLSVMPNFLNSATKLSVERIKSIKAIENDFNLIMKKISKSEINTKITYRISDSDVTDWEPEDVKILLEKRQKELFDAELASGNSLVGPHKHDIAFLYSEKDSRIYCSQGQQRALILSFKMAQIMYHRQIYGSFPILILDDVLSELDDEKRNSLIEFLNKIETQIFITTTDFSLSEQLESKDNTVFHVKEGNVLLEGIL